MIFVGRTSLRPIYGTSAVLGKVNKDMIALDAPVFAPDSEGGGKAEYCRWWLTSENLPDF